MLVPDTNVVSESKGPACDLVITSWIAERATPSLFLTAVTEAELRFGLASMPPGKRPEGLASAFGRMPNMGFASRVPPFDSSAAHAYAEIAGARHRAGRPIPIADCQIAAIA